MDESSPESDKRTVTEPQPWLGKDSAAFIDTLKPAWGNARRGVQYGVALNTSQRRFRAGQRIPMTVFFRNASNKTLWIDTYPDYFGTTPKVVDPKGAVVEIEKVALLGTPFHWREPLKPGEAFGPLHFTLCLGENPRPDKQVWHPNWKTPLPGQYKLTHTLSMKIADPERLADPSHGDESANAEWKDAEVTSGAVEFEIVDGGKP